MTAALLALLTLALLGLIARRRAAAWGPDADTPIPYTLADPGRLDEETEEWL